MVLKRSLVYRYACHVLLFSACSRAVSQPHGVAQVFLSVPDPVQFSCAFIPTKNPTHSHFHAFPVFLAHLFYVRSSVFSHAVILLWDYIILEMLSGGSGIKKISNWKELIAHCYFPRCNLCGTNFSQFVRICLVSRNISNDEALNYRFLQELQVELGKAHLLCLDCLGKGERKRQTPTATVSFEV